MEYHSELQLLCDLFRRAGSSVSTVDPNGPMSQFLTTQLYIPGLSEKEDLSVPLREYLPQLQPETVYSITDRLFLKYTYLLLPNSDPESLLVFGPYLEKELSEQAVLELTESMDIPPAQQKFLQKYYSSLPVIDPEGHLQLLMTIFYERLWGPDNFTYAPYNRDTISDFTAFL